MEPRPPLLDLLWNKLTGGADPSPLFTVKELYAYLLFALLFTDLLTSALNDCKHGSGNPSVNVTLNWSKLFRTFHRRSEVVGALRNFVIISLWLICGTDLHKGLTLHLFLLLWYFSCYYSLHFSSQACLPVLWETANTLQATPQSTWLIFLETNNSINIDRSHSDFY